MEKNANILEYLEKYKQKYDIKYAQEGGKLVKGLSITSSIIWIYSFFWLAISIFSFGINFSVGVLKFSDFKNVFIFTVICTVTMIAAAVLFICKQKIIGLIIAIITQPIIFFTYKPINVYGMGYRPRFYFAYAVPAILLILVAGILLFILIRAAYKTNKLYNNIVDGLYKQYSSKNGEKLTDTQWQEFLTNYNPYKK